MGPLLHTTVEEEQKRRLEQAREQRQDQHSADHHDGERLLRLGADAGRDGRGQEADQRDRGGHEHRPQPALRCQPRTLGQAVLAGASYIGVGPTFPSATKTFPEFPGLDFVRAATRETSLPCFVIGGVNGSGTASGLLPGKGRSRPPHDAVGQESPRLMRFPAGEGRIPAPRPGTGPFEQPSPGE